MSGKYKKVINATYRLADLPKLAAEVSGIITSSGAKPIVLWLSGELGAGKTTFVRALLHALGLAQGVPVLSPTYTFLTEYETPRGLCAHMDLYRLAEGDVDSIESLLSSRDYWALLVEWPLRASCSPYLTKTHEISLEFSSKEDLRNITVESFC